MIIEMKKRIYLAYGSNMNLPQMAMRCPTAKPLGTTVVEDYQLLFRGNPRSAVATIEPSEGVKVPALLWEIKAKDEVALDKYEGYPFFYEKETLEVELNGEKVKAMVYIMTEGHEFGSPNCHYYSSILEGYQSAGFDPQILKEGAEKSGGKFE